MVNLISNVRNLAEHIFSSGWMPAPVYFGATIDSTCLKWAGPVGAKGACKVYDNVAFRQRYIGLISGLQTLGTLLMILLLVVLILKKPAAKS